MSSKSPEPDGLQIVIARYERRIETVQRIQELIKDDPLLASEITAALNGRKSPPQNQDRLSNFDTIRDFFENRNNAWTATPEISQAVGFSRGSVSQVLYDKKHSKQFEKKAKPGSKKIKMWRLRREVM